MFAGGLYEKAGSLLTEYPDADTELRKLLAHPPPHLSEQVESRSMMVRRGPHLPMLALHLKHIFAALGVRRQFEVARVVMVLLKLPASKR